jgi:hypothetical protein
MVLTLVAVMCKLLVAEPTIKQEAECTNEEVKVEVVITNTNHDPLLSSYTVCPMFAQIVMMDWKVKHPIYSDKSYRLVQIICAPGLYEPRGSI